jgi:hypothetical protein
MPNINRPSRKHETNFRTKDGDQWLPFTDEKHINLMISAFMEINKKVIWDKGILKTCNGAFAKLPGRPDFASVSKDPGVWISFRGEGIEHQTVRSACGTARLFRQTCAPRERL